MPPGHVEIVPAKAGQAPRPYANVAQKRTLNALSPGTHPIADDLRSLGLPKKPLMATWAGKMVMSFEPPEKL